MRKTKLFKYPPCLCRSLLLLLILICSSAMFSKAEGKVFSIAQQQNKVVSGIVTHYTSGQPIPGVTVYIKGTRKGTVSNSKGEYILNLDTQEVQEIVFSFIGMETQVVTIKLSSIPEKLNVTLKESAESMDEVVVTGYAPIKKESFTGNSTRISKDEIIKVSPTNIISAIQVFDPSFRLTDNNLMGSDPNTVPEFYIRGRNSITFDVDQADISRQNLNSNNNLPIFILDGFEVEVEKIYDMDPSRIKSATLLKDAAATALYGSRAANGIVVIETRDPEPGKLRVQYSLTGSVEFADLRSYNLSNAAECLQAELDAGFYNLTGTTITDLSGRAEYYDKLNEVNRGVDTYWLSQGINTVFNHKHNVFIDGGDSNVRWSAELRYGNNDGIMEHSKRDSYGGGLSLDYKIGKVQLTDKIDFDAVKSNNSPFSFSDYSHKLPYNATKDANGKYLKRLKYGNNTSFNPLYEDKYLNNFDNSGYQEISNNFAINVFLSHGLSVKAWLAVNKKWNNSESFIDPLSSINGNASQAVNNRGSLTKGNGESFYYDANLLLKYNNQIGKNYLNLSLGFNARETNTTNTVASYRGFANSTQHSPNDARIVYNGPTETSNKTRLIGTLLTANYTYDNIYLFDFSGRIDGSSEFGSSKRTAPFYSTGFGINIHNYKFMEDNVVSRLKLRATYGMIGKVGYSAYVAQTGYISSSTESWYTTGAGYLLYSMGNSDLGWEKTKVTDAGFDLGLFKDRVTLTATFYNKITVDQITSVTLPASSGFSSYIDNLGKIRNRGFELDLRYNILNNKDWNLTFYANMSQNKNRIMEINDALRSYNKLVQSQYAGYDSNSTSTQYSKTYTQYVEGGSLTSIFGMKSLGINPANGKEVFMKYDGTITYDWEASEQIVIGDTEPKAQGSFGINGRWKNFSLFASFLYEWGGQRYNSTIATEIENAAIGYANVDRRVNTDRWHKEGDIVPLKDIKDRTLITRPTSRFVQDFNKLSFNSLSISYDLDNRILEKCRLSMVRFTASMQDLAYWSSIRQERGLDYPFSHTVNFSLNITF